MKCHFIKQIPGWENARLYKLAGLVEFGFGDAKGVTEFIIVSKVNNMMAKETFIFPSDANGKELQLVEMPGSKRGWWSHEAILADAGYELVY